MKFRVKYRTQHENVIETLVTAKTPFEVCSIVRSFLDFKKVIQISSLD